MGGGTVLLLCGVILLCIFSFLPSFTVEGLIKIKDKNVQLAKGNACFWMSVSLTILQRVLGRCFKYKCVSLLSSGFSYIHMVRTGILQGWPAPRDNLVPLQYPDIVLCVLQRGGGSFCSCGRKFTHPVIGK